MVSEHNLRGPARGNEGGVDTTRQGCREDVRNLETDQEGEGDDERRVFALLVVRRIGEEQVQVSEKGAGVCYEEGTESQDWSNQAVLRSRSIRITD